MSLPKSSYSKNKLKEYLKNGASERLIPEIGAGYAYYYEGLARYFFASQFSGKKDVLDLGCGSGFGSFILSKYGNSKSVLGVDISEDTINYAKHKYQLKNVGFQVGDVQSLKNLGQKYNIILGFEIIEHILNQENFLNGIKGLLSDDGVAIISTPNKYTYPEGNPYHVKELYPEEFKKLLKKYFKYVDFYYQSYEFSQSIKPKPENKIYLEEKFGLGNYKTYSLDKNYKDCHYIVAVVSQSRINKAEGISFSSMKVDNFDLENGFMSLHTRFNKLHGEVITLNDVIKDYRKELNNIYSSKFFKFWTFYGKFKNLFK